MKDARLNALQNWAQNLDLPSPLPADAMLKPVSDDASFRRYFRFEPPAPGLIFVDAPPEQEDNQSFVKIATAIRSAGLTCPQIYAFDFEQGFMVLSDLGDRLYQYAIENDPEATSRLYDQAVAALLTMIDVQCEVPAYDQAKLNQEMSLFHDWFLGEQLGLTLNAEQMAMMERVYQMLSESALQQPLGFVHRDYHSRNLMIVDAQGPGIIDFQDALMGPITYDLVSLFKDCYYRFDRAEVVQRVGSFHLKLVEQNRVSPSAPFLRWFDLMGAQRHLKCAGIFSRLNLRDGKPGYLPDIPLVVDYLIEVAALYDELEEFGTWMSQYVLPRMSDACFRREHL